MKRWTPCIVSMVAFLAIVSLVFGTTFGALFTFILASHELGHYYVAKKIGVPCSPPFFIPFLGAVIHLDPKNIDSADDEAKIGIGGPVGGILATALIYLFGIILGYSHSKDLNNAVLFSGVMHLFNLIPARPLDGCRILQVFGKCVKPVGIVLVLGLLYFHYSVTGSIFHPILLLLVIAVITDQTATYSLNVERDIRYKWTLCYFIVSIVTVSLIISASSAKITPH
jgi:Zn-dependent protease